MSKPFFEMILPLPPSVNKYWRHAVKNGYGKTYLSLEAKKFTLLVQELVLVNRLRKFTPNRLKGEFIVHAKDRRKIDIDNRIKSTLDSLQKAGVFLDDEQFDEILIKRGEIIKGGAIEVKLWECE